MGHGSWGRPTDPGTRVVDGGRGAGLGFEPSVGRRKCQRNVGVVPACWVLLRIGGGVGRRGFGVGGRVPNRGGRGARASRVERRAFCPPSDGRLVDVGPRRGGARRLWRNRRRVVDGGPACGGRVFPQPCFRPGDVVGLDPGVGPSHLPNPLGSGPRHDFRRASWRRGGCAVPFTGPALVEIQGEGWVWRGTLVVK